MRSQISKIMFLALAAFVVCLAVAPVVMAAGEEDAAAVKPPVGTGGGLAGLGAGLGIGLLVFGAGTGIGRIASAACESIARQPEAASNISGAMILTAALIEGVALFGAIICLLVSLNVR